MVASLRRRWSKPGVLTAEDLAWVIVVLTRFTYRPAGTPPPNLSFLRKVAATLGARIEVKLLPTETRTWELCGTLEVAEPKPEYVVGRDEQGRPITNYAEHVDDVLYRGH